MVRTPKREQVPPQPTSMPSPDEAVTGASLLDAPAPD